MIADIEFRFVKRSAVSKGIPTAKEVWNGAVVTVLQFRTKIMKADPFGAWIDEWTDWQDVPVVEE
jgi:hypothetical protein